MYGTLMSWDVFKTQQQTAPQFGIEAAWENLRVRIDLQNGILREALGLFVDFTTEAEIAAYGLVSGQVELIEIGEGPATPPPQKVSVETGNMGFPLRRFSNTIQWDRDYIETAPLSELAGQVDSASEAALLRTQVELRRAIFRPGNYAFRDRFVTKRILSVKAFLNGDGMPIPRGPHGMTFDANTHTHYLATPSLTPGNVSALVETVLHHYLSGGLRLYINAAQAPAIEAMPNFAPFRTETLQGQVGVTAVGGTANLVDPYNRDMGLWDGHVLVCVRPWIPAGYMFCYNARQRKPLAMRERAAGRGVLRLIAEYATHPLQAQKWLLEMGFGVQERTNGACLYIGGNNYIAPVINF